MKRIVLVLAGVIFMIGFGNYALAQMCGTSCETPSKAGYAEAAETAVMANNEYCPVTGEKIQKGHENDITYEYNGKIYSFCCPACLQPFKKDPEKYIKGLESKETVEAKIDNDHKGYQHHMQTMGEEKKLEINNTTCPVCGGKITEKMKVPCEHKDEVCNVCSAACAKKFEKDPEKYLKKLDKMLEQEEKKAQTLQDKQ